MAAPVALTIAGSDSGGGAGIQADLRCFARLGLHGTSVITCVTAQNTVEVRSVHALPVAVVEQQLAAVLDDLAPSAVKTGMLFSAEVVELVAGALPDGMPLVVDPVMVATSGDELAAAGFDTALPKLLGRATVVTPNADELRLLTGLPVSTEDEALGAARALLSSGAEAVLAKGGHVGRGATVVDLLVTCDGVDRFEHPRVPGSLHGAGCHYSALLAGALALGHTLGPAVALAHGLMRDAVARSYRPGAGPAVPDPVPAWETGPDQVTR